MYACSTSRCLQFRKQIASRSITVEEAEALLLHKKSALLSGFQSTKTPKRAFSAYLVLDVESGAVKFEFEPRQ
ncbi:DNA topoisomerase III [compost metagenome]